jgi:antitoxin YefM
MLCSALLCSACRLRREFHENDSSVSFVDCLRWRRVESIHEKSHKMARKSAAYLTVLPVRARRRLQRYTEDVPDTDIQIVSNEAGEPTAVIVPIELWREIASERETAYLLKSEAMKQRLLQAMQRQDGLALEAVVEKLSLKS